MTREMGRGSGRMESQQRHARAVQGEGPRGKACSSGTEARPHRSSPAAGTASRSPRLDTSLRERHHEASRTLRPSPSGEAAILRPGHDRIPIRPVIEPSILPSVDHRPRRGLSVGMLLLTAAESLARNKTRTFLAMLGVIIGVGSVIAMLALGEGTRRAMEAEVLRWGTNTLSVRPRQARRGGVALGEETPQRLSLEDTAAILNDCPTVVRVAPRVEGSAQVKFENRNTRSRIMGITNDFFPIRALEIERGRDFTEREAARGSRVCILGSEVAAMLFGQRDPVGKRMMVQGRHFQVIGVLRAKGGDQGFWDDRVWVPLRTAMRRMFAKRYVDRVEIQAVDQASLVAAQEQIETVLRKRHKIREGREDDFEVRNQADRLETANATSGALAALLAGIAAVSLVVGGIGIMNILLVSIAERTREIGIRRALGAYRRDILAQFLIESLLMCGIGALFGVGAGLAASWVGATYAKWPIEVTPVSLILSTTCAIAVGVIFGIYPAFRASSLTPLQALRTER